MGFVPGIARSHFSDGSELGLQHNFVTQPLFLGVLTTDREGARDVACITVVLGACVDQDQVTVFQHLVVFGVVQNTGIGAAADDRWIGRRARAGLHKAMQQLGFDLVFTQARFAHHHRTTMGGSGDAGRLTHGFEFLTALEQPHLVHHMTQRYKLIWRVDAGAALARYAVQPAHEALVEVRVATHGEEDTVFVLDQTRQNVVEVGNWKSVVGTVQLTGPFQTSAPAVPGLCFVVALTTKQNELALWTIRYQYQHRFRFWKTGQVVKIAIGSVRIINVAVTDALGRVGLDHDAAMACDIHQAFATTGEFSLLHATSASSV